MNTKEGSTILGASVVDDILVVLVLSFSLSFLTGEASSNASLPLVLIEQLVYCFYFLISQMDCTLLAFICRKSVRKFFYYHRIASYLFRYVLRSGSCRS